MGGFDPRRLMLGHAIEGMEPVEAAHLLTSALLALTGDVAREITLRPERR